MLIALLIAVRQFAFYPRGIIPIRRDIALRLSVRSSLSVRRSVSSSMFPGSVRQLCRRSVSSSSRQLTSIRRQCQYPSPNLLVHPYVIALVRPFVHRTVPQSVRHPFHLSVRLYTFVHVFIRPSRRLVSSCERQFVHSSSSQSIGHYVPVRIRISASARLSTDSSIFHSARTSVRPPPPHQP